MPKTFIKSRFESKSCNKSLDSVAGAFLGEGGGLRGFFPLYEPEFFFPVYELFIRGLVVFLRFRVARDSELQFQLVHVILAAHTEVLESLNQTFYRLLFTLLLWFS